MSDEELTPEEALLKRQRKEKRDLQATIQGLKKTASKGDKKKKKEVAEEIAKLEQELNDKHDLELKELHAAGPAVASASDTEKTTAGDVIEIAEKIVDIDIKEKKVSKAQKRRDKKAEKEKERQEDIAKQEEENKHGQRHIETEKIKELLASRGMKIHDIPSNGDCLFASLAHQLDNNANVPGLRKLVAETMMNHKDDYQPFLSLDDSGFVDYCQKIATTPKWGGHVEISALSKALKVPIQVLQAEGPPVEVGLEEFNSKTPIILTYHRHYYGLGEHYNSVAPLS